MSRSHYYLVPNRTLLGAHQRTSKEPIMSYKKHAIFSATPKASEVLSSTFPSTPLFVIPDNTGGHPSFGKAFMSIPSGSIDG
jgi:hypothetical protein